MSGQRRKAGRGPSSASKRAKKSIDLGWKEQTSRKDDDDEIESEDEEYFDKQESSAEEEEETVDAKRVRLARAYLQKLEAQESSSSEEEEEEDLSTQDRVAQKLQRERLKRDGMLERAVADAVEKDVTWMQDTVKAKNAEQQAKAWIDSGKIKYLRGHDLTPTCVALQANGERALSGSKDNSVILWDIQQNKRITHVCKSWRKAADTPRGDGEALSVACSDDGRYAVVGRRDATVNIFDIRLSGKSNGSNLVTSFKGHKGPVTCLAFRTQSLQLFSGSEDRCIRHYNLEEMMYVETLYGHQAGVTAIDCHRKERPISVGMDRTARAWKLAEDTHLIFRGGSKMSSADCLSVVKDDWFVTGHDDGNLSLWMTEKKKAVATIDHAHGQVGHIGRGVQSVGCLKGSDMVVSGSNDGYLRLWKVMTGDTLSERGIEALARIPLHGFVNDVAVGSKARFCVVAVGQEPRLGRWDRVARAKNRFGIVQLRREAGADNESDEEEAQDVSLSAFVDKDGSSSSDDDDSGSSSDDD